MCYFNNINPNIFKKTFDWAINGQKVPKNPKNFRDILFFANIFFSKKYFYTF